MPPKRSCAVAAPVKTTVSRATRMLTVRRNRMSTTPLINRTLKGPSYGWNCGRHSICDGCSVVCDEMRVEGGERWDEFWRQSHLQDGSIRAERFSAVKFPARRYEKARLLSWTRLPRRSHSDGAEHPSTSVRS